MAAAAHNPAFAKKVGVPVSVAKEFNKADTGKKFKEGGIMATKKLFGGKETFGEEKKEAQALRAGKISERGFVKGEKSEGHKEENSKMLAKNIKSGKLTPTAYAKMESKEPKGMRAGGKVSQLSKADGVAIKGKSKGKEIKMCGGGYMKKGK